MIGTALLIAALVVFILATLGIPSPPRVNLIALGLALYVAAAVFGRFV